jgi:hypothetical protein
MRWPTDPSIFEFAEKLIAKYRSMTPAEKVQQINELNKAARERAAARLRTEHPEWGDKEILAEVARLMLSGNEEYFA